MAGRSQSGVHRGGRRSREVSSRWCEVGGRCAELDGVGEAQFARPIVLVNMNDRQHVTPRANFINRREASRRSLGVGRRWCALPVLVRS
jgi:hypothetical protein